MLQITIFVFFICALIFSDECDAYKKRIRELEIGKIHAEAERDYLIETYRTNENIIDSQKTNFKENVEAKVNSELKWERVIRTAGETIIGIIAALTTFLALFYRKKSKQ